MINKNLISDIAEALQDKAIQYRHDFHRYPEAAWAEYRTSAQIADILSALDYTIQIGRQITDRHSINGIPSAIEAERQAERAAAQGANPIWLEKMSGSKTGVIAAINGKYPGPTVALRIEIDANELDEAKTIDHRPYKAGFCSVNPGLMHACAHDGHIAIGLVTAEIIASLKKELCGTFKLIFQPAEEIAAGGKAMTAAGVADDIDYLIGIHIGLSMNKTGHLACDMENIMASARYTVEFSGHSVHATASPELGKNALLAAAAASLNLQSIIQHSNGQLRLNISRLSSTGGSAIIPGQASLTFETFAGSAKLNNELKNQAIRVINGAAAMYGAVAAITQTGEAPSGENTLIFASRIANLARQNKLFAHIQPSSHDSGGNDISWFMEKVQQNGGQSAYLIFGSRLTAGHHQNTFDFDESSLVPAIKLIASTVVDLLDR